MRDSDRPDHAKPEDDRDGLRLVAGTGPCDLATRTANAWRRASASGWSRTQEDPERCRHGCTAGQFCEVCDDAAS